MRFLQILVVALMSGLSWLSGVVSGQEAAATNAESPVTRGRVVILGDSITAGYGLSLADAYPALLQQKVKAAGLPFEIANAGVSGDTTAGGLRRVEWALKSGAAVLVVALGGNDGLRGISPAVTAQNLAGIIRKAKAKVPGIAVVVAGMQMPANMGQEFTRAYEALFSQTAKAEGAALVPFLLQGVGGSVELNQPDRIHPTAKGQAMVAENVWKVLRPVLEQRAAGKL